MIKWVYITLVSCSTNNNKNTLLDGDATCCRKSVKSSMVAQRIPTSVEFEVWTNVIKTPDLLGESVFFYFVLKVALLKSYPNCTFIYRFRPRPPPVSLYPHPPICHIFTIPISFVSHLSYYLRTLECISHLTPSLFHLSRNSGFRPMHYLGVSFVANGRWKWNFPHFLWSKYSETDSTRSRRSSQKKSICYSSNCVRGQRCIVLKQR